MKNSYAQRLRRERDISADATRQGMMTMSLMVMLAANNVFTERFSEKETGELLKELEDEINRIYNEVLQSVPSGDVGDMAEIIMFHVDELREKYGMEPLIKKENPNG